MALQPKLNLQKTKKTIGFEALARWKLTNGRFISPDEFIEIAETSGLICELGSVILDKVLTVIKCLQRNGVNLPVAYNVSSYELMEPSYFEKSPIKLNKFYKHLRLK
ncbi:EAL domain-containing protein (plasmid) [Pseudoalteromonas espejiana]